MDRRVALTAWPVLADSMAAAVMRAGVQAILAVLRTGDRSGLQGVMEVLQLGHEVGEVVVLVGL